MKVLFAVSNENISSAIIKRYPKDYREILSYKNVYYFNAILKEIQKDKSYDRIVISEDLEPFVNTNHDSIDNFIFEHLDRISDEAHDNQGKETSIILICSERRTPGSSILNKLFSIGIYNAVMGKDRNLTELCKLINRPRTKKEAKIYYRIEQANYDPVSENEVNEVEIQSILAHFKKLGKNTERYADSFNNIAAQYTDEQLRVIVNVLPIKVKAVLETESPKYQALMGTYGNESVAQNMNIEPGISVNTIGKTGNINGPIVIPTGIKKPQSRTVASQPQRPVAQQPQPTTPVQPTKRSVQNAQVQARPVQPTKQQAQQSVQRSQVQSVQQPVQKNVQQAATRPVQPAKTVQQPIQTTVSTQNKTAQVPQQVETTQPVQEPTPVAESTPVQETKIEEKPKRGRGRPRKNPIVQEVPEQKNDDLNNLLNSVTTSEVPEEEEETMLPGMGFEDEGTSEDELPGLEPNNEDGVLPGFEENDEESVLPGFEETNNEDVLPGFEDNNTDDVLPGFEDNQPEETTIPGLEETSEDELPGLGPNNEDGVLPGFEENDEEGVLPGFEETNNEDVLPGFEDNNTDDVLPGFEDNQPEETTIPGLEKTDEELPGVEEGEDVDVDSLLSDLDIGDEIDSLPNIEETETPAFEPQETVTPISSEVENNFTEEEPIIPGLDDESTLPGMEAEEDTTYQNTNYYTQPAPEPKQQEVVDTIKPKVNYSMSNLNSLLSKDKKIVSFVGTTKNGTSFLVNNLALMLSMVGINTAILDMTENRNSYYIFTDSREELRNIAYTSIGKLENGYSEGIKVNKNFTVYTALPADGNKYENAEPILSTLVQNHSLILIDCDFQTPPAYFASSQEIYLVQSMDILTIQPLTAFLRELKFKGAWEPEKARVVINKETKIKALNEKMIVAGMSRYNGPDMSVMTDLFNKDMVKACSIPFDEKVYSKYLETMATCKLSLSGYSKPFMQKMQILGEMVYPRLNNKKTYSPMDNANQPNQINTNNVFSNNMNNTLNQMKNKF